MSLKAAIHVLKGSFISKITKNTLDFDFLEELQILTLALHSRRVLSRQTIDECVLIYGEIYKSVN